MTERRVPHNRLTHGREELEAVSRVVDSGYWAAGPEVARLEAGLVANVGGGEAVAVGSGLAALRLALIGLDVGPGDDVIVPAYSCVALATAAAAVGARAVPVDVEPGSWNIAIAEVRRALTPATRAVIAVHTFGAPAEIDGLTALGIPVVEDCAHYFGAGVGAARAGRRGAVSILSFYATKLMGAGEGGAVLTRDSAIAARVRAHRSYVDRAMDSRRLNDKMSDLAAALARCQLSRLPEMLDARARIAGAYDKGFAPLAASGRCALPEHRPDRVWYRYTLAPTTMTAVEAVKALAAHGVDADLPVWNWLDSATPLVARQAYSSLVSLPLYPSLDQSQVDQVIGAVRAVLAG